MLKFPLQILIHSADFSQHFPLQFPGIVSQDGLVQAHHGQDGPGQYPSFWFHENLIAEIARQDTEKAFS